jgi:hypothetical protein
MNIWQILGIEPSQDTGEIKKAYAAKLKVTRPDDNAAAYQQLRGAYQLALEHAKSTPFTSAVSNKNQHSDGSLVEAHTTIQVADAGMSSVPQMPCQSTDTKEKYSSPNEATSPKNQIPHLSLPTPEQIIQQVFQHWDIDNDLTLVAYWPQLKQTLMDAPLDHVNYYSNVLAEMVISYPKLPPQFIELLSDHFGWTEDFKWQRSLPPLWQTHCSND